MSRTYETTPGKRFQVVLRRPTARAGIVMKKFFDTQEDADFFIESNEATYNCEFIDLAYFKAV